MDTSNWTLKAPTMSKAQNMIYKIHVLLVDHDSNAHAPIIDMFEYFSYKVTSVSLASNALSILSKGKPKFDLLMENIKSPDTCGYKLLQDAIQMDMPVILLLDEDDHVFAKRALEDGVLLCIRKPVSIEITKYLWQLVLREKIHRRNKNERLRELMTSNRLNGGVGEEDLVRDYLSDNTSSDESHKSKKIKCSKTANQDKESSLEHQDIIRFKRKFWTEWTQELHEKFIGAIRKLGEGSIHGQLLPCTPFVSTSIALVDVAARHKYHAAATLASVRGVLMGGCYPKDILELMNVPGLTRMQVASHLQKCRRGTWQHPNERKPKIATPKTTSRRTSNPAKSKRYGSMPDLGYNSQPHSDIQENHENDQDQFLMMYSSTGDNVLGCNSEGLSPEGCHSQLHGKPHDSNGYDPFSDDRVETKNMEYVGLTFGIGNTFMPNEKFLIDVTHIGNASLDESNASEEYFEFPSMDSMIRNFCVSEQEPIDYSESWDAIDLDPVYSNQVPIMLDTKIDQCKETSKPDNCGETEGQKMEE